MRATRALRMADRDEGLADNDALLRLLLEKGKAILAEGEEKIGSEPQVLAFYRLRLI